jgi:1,3-beta-glucan synthase
VLLVVFLALIVGPIVAGKQLKLDLPSLPMEILQPTGFNNNDTKATTTGKCLQDPCPEFQGEGGDAAGGGGGASTTDTGSSRFRRYMAY